MSDDEFTSMFPDLADIDLPMGWNDDLAAMRQLINVASPHLPARVTQTLGWGREADVTVAREQMSEDGATYGTMAVEELVQRARQQAFRVGQLMTGHRSNVGRGR